MKHIITNNLELDAIKDNYEPQKMTDMRDDTAEHLLSSLNLSFDSFFERVKKEGEYHTDKGHNFFLTSDVSNFIKDNKLTL